MRRISKAILAAALVGASVLAMAGPASAAVFSCDVVPVGKLDVEIPVTASGPAAVAVGETNRYSIQLSLGGVVPPELDSLKGTASSAVATVVLPENVEVDPSTATVTGVSGATVAISGRDATVNIPGPIPFGGGASLPDLEIGMDVKATQAGEIIMTTEGSTAALELEAALTPGSDPIAIVADCVAGDPPSTLLVVSASEVASATQVAAPTATQTATTSPDIASTGAESTLLSGVALLMVGFGMLAVAGQRVVAFRRD